MVWCGVVGKCGRKAKHWGNPQGRRMGWGATEAGMDWVQAAQPRRSTAAVVAQMRAAAAAAPGARREQGAQGACGVEE